MTTVPGDAMPVFVIKASDALCPLILTYYVNQCLAHDLAGQADEVRKAAAEIAAWQNANPERVHMPDHKHVPRMTGGVL